MKAFAPLAADNLTKAGNTLTQRVLRTAGGATVTVRLELAGLADGQHAGQCHYAATYAGLGVRRSGTATTIAHNVGGTLTTGPVISQNAVWLRTSWDVNGVSRFSYSLDGNAFTSFGGTYQLTWGGYRGDRVGIYTYNPNGTGYADVDSVQYTLASTRAYLCVSVRSGKLADVFNTSNVDGAAVIQWPNNGRSNQHWTFQSTGDGYHTITCLHSGKVLDVAGSSTADGAAVVQATADGPDEPAVAAAPADRRRIHAGQPQQRQGTRRQVRQHGRRCALIQYRDVGSSNQRRTFDRVTG